MKTIEEQNLYNYLRSDLNTLSDMSFDIAMNNYLKTSITNDIPIFNNIKNRYDIFVSNLNTDTFRTLFVVQVPNDKRSNVIIQSRVDKRYYKEESFDKFMRMYKKNLYDILEL